MHSAKRTPEKSKPLGPMVDLLEPRMLLCGTGVPDSPNLAEAASFQLPAATSATAGAAELSPVVTRITLPTSVVSGGTSRGAAVVAVTNSGPATESGLGTVAVYASLDGAIDTSSTLLGSLKRNLAIKPEGTLDVTVPIKSIPAGLDGAYTLLAETVDASGSIGEADTGPASKIAPAYVSFSETFVKTTLPSEAVSGQPTTAALQVKIQNNGNVTSSGSSTLAVYASQTASTTNGTLITSMPDQLVLKPDATRVVTIPLKAIPSLADGNYQLVVQVTDPKGDATSTASGATCNIATASLNYAVTVNAFTPTTLTLGGDNPIAMSVTITNTGNIPMGDAQDVDAIVIAPGVTNGSDTLRDLYLRAAQSVIGVGKSVTVKFRFKSTLEGTITLPAGQYYPIVDVADYQTSSDTLANPTMTIRGENQSIVLMLNS